MPIPKVAAPPMRKLLTDDVYGQLLDAIVSGRLEPGAKVSEEGLAKQYGVSRSPVREAVDRLAMIGLVRQAPRRGTRIAEVDPVIVAETIEALFPIVVESTRIVVEVADDRERRSLLTRLDQRGADASGLVRPDGLFEQIMTVLGNDRALRLFTDLVPHVRRAWGLDPSMVPAGLSVEAVASFRRAIDDGDADVAADVIEQWFDGQVA